MNIKVSNYRCSIYSKSFAHSCTLSEEILRIPRSSYSRDVIVTVSNKNMLGVTGAILIVHNPLPYLQPEQNRTEVFSKWYTWT